MVYSPKIKHLLSPKLPTSQRRYASPIVNSYGGKEWFGGPEQVLGSVAGGDGASKAVDKGSQSVMKVFHSMKK